ncbi:hypothetical protein I4U23_003052 [Adineta vaga]|nr:hypothetical protein I4U23_003052 [Adineta vaga]
MNQFLCEPNVIIFENITAYQFAQATSHISIYILPLLAFAGNSLTLLVILTNSHLNRSSFSVYVKSLAISDTLVLLFKFLSYQNKTSKYYYPSFCTILISCGEATVLLSIWTIVAITIERTSVVLFPFHRKKFVSAYRARITICIIATLAILFSARILIIPIDQSIKQTKRCHPKVNWASYRNINKTITEFCYCYIPLTIVIIGNLLTVCTVKRAFLRRNGLVENSSFHQKRRIKFNENQLTLMLLIVTVMFIIDFVPFTIVDIIARWGLPFHLCFTQKAFEIYIIIRSFCELLKDLNFCTNFLIYCLSGRRFRYALYSLCKCRCHRSSLTSTSFDHKKYAACYTPKLSSKHKTLILLSKSNVQQTEF